VTKGAKEARAQETGGGGLRADSSEEGVPSTGDVSGTRGRAAATAQGAKEGAGARGEP
jgi:hypothetical protein